MNILDILDNRRSELNGRVISDDEKALLLQLFIDLNIGWLVEIMIDFPLIGCNFSLENPFTEMEWMSPRNMVSESREFYPGIAAIKSGYFPIGDCLIGSGDPYFIYPKIIDSPLFRIPHDSVTANSIISYKNIETISPSLSSFLKEANIC
jgi:hypothetical protein